MELHKHIFLVGFMGCGKSTVAKLLSESYNVRHIDTDAEIVNEQKMSIADIFERYGEEHFRKLETNLLLRLKEEAPAVIACGGGMAVRDANIDIMKSCGTVIMLTATPETIYKRVRHQTDRPILNGHMNVEYISDLMDKRTPYYNRASDVKVTTDNTSPEEIVQKIVEII